MTTVFKNFLSLVYFKSLNKTGKVRTCQLILVRCAVYLCVLNTTEMLTYCFETYFFLADFLLSKQWSK